MFNPFRRSADPVALPDLQIPERKAAPTLIAAAFRRSQSVSRDYETLCRDGFAHNPIAHRCVRLIAESAASVPLQTSHADMARVLNRGLPGSSAVETFEAFYGYLQVGGNAFLEAILGGEEPIALIAHRPDSLHMGTDSQGRPTGWEQQVEGRTRRFPRDLATGRCVLHHMRLFNPADECHGQSPLSAAAQALDLHNRGGVWAKSLLENSARPSGALVHEFHRTAP